MSQLVFICKIIKNILGQLGSGLRRRHSFATRECILDPADLSDDMSVKSTVVDSAGDLIVQWCHDQQRSVYHSGWLRHIAENQHRPSSWLPMAQAWTTSSMSEVPRVDGAWALESDALNPMIRIPPVSCCSFWLLMYRILDITISKVGPKLPPRT